MVLGPAASVKEGGPWTLTSTLLRQKLCIWDPAICVFTSLPGDSVQITRESHCSGSVVTWAENGNDAERGPRSAWALLRPPGPEKQPLLNGPLLTGASTPLDSRQCSRVACCSGNQRACVALLARRPRVRNCCPPRPCMRTLAEGFTGANSQSARGSRAVCPGQARAGPGGSAVSA